MRQRARERLGWQRLRLRLRRAGDQGLKMSTQVQPGFHVRWGCGQREGLLGTALSEIPPGPCSFIRPTGGLDRPHHCFILSLLFFGFRLLLLLLLIQRLKPLLNSLQPLRILFPFRGFRG